jgi:hypothetical protein
MTSIQRLLGIALMLATSTAFAADHGDSPAVGADPASDIGDLYAWTAADGTRVNLVMTFPAAAFSDQTQYVFHIGSGPTLGVTTENYLVLCRFDATQTIECWAGEQDDYVKGNANVAEGLDGTNGRFTVFAGQRNDPFFFNINGFIEVINMAKAGVDSGAITLDVALCPELDAPTAMALVRQLRSEPGGGQPTDDFANLDVAALVLSIDLDLVTAGGDVLAVWGATYVP